MHHKAHVCIRTDAQSSLTDCQPVFGKYGFQPPIVSDGGLKEMKRDLRLLSFVYIQTSGKLNHTWVISRPSWAHVSPQD